jgi:hypothetical protein
MFEEHFICQKNKHIPIYNRDGKKVRHLRTLYPTKGRDEK